ncbi:MAG: hypothetical protein ACI8W7_003822 [Gammaproteobacteria bacterium]|jgi:hypothetical protein
MDKRVFFITSGRLRAYHFSGQFTEPVDFAADEQGLERFSTYLEASSQTPVNVLVDFVEEEFREESIPHVMGSDRKAVVATKLARLFRDSTYAHALFQSRSKEGRRDDQMLFTALTRPDLLAPWMGLLTKFKVPVSGVCSLPLLSKDVLKLLKLNSRYLLLVTLQSSGGLRQTFFVDGVIKVSRLAVLQDASPARFTANMLGEVERLRRYLSSLRILPADEALDVYVLASKEVQADVERHSPTSITARHHVIALADAAQKVGIKQPYKSRFADHLFAHVVARVSPRNQYAPASQTRYFRLHKIRRVTIAASLFLLMGGLAWSASKFVDGLASIEDARSVSGQAQFYKERYEAARARLPRTPTESRNMKRVVDSVEVLQRFRTTPLPMMQVLSIALESFPQVHLDAVRWGTSTDPQAVAATGQTSSAARPNVAKKALTAETLQLFQIATITAQIRPFSGNYREALETVRQFATHLRAVPGVEDVRVESMPLDIGPDSSLRGSAQTIARGQEAVFVLRVAIVGPEPGGRV